jgi:hypothetical protein
MMNPRDMISDSDDVLDEVLIELHGVVRNTDSPDERKRLETLIRRVANLQFWLPVALNEDE